MDNAPTSPDLQALLRDTAWMRRLAGDLLRRPDDADDLVQDALLIAIETPPGRVKSLTAWMRTVLRNRATDMGRRERERPNRERAAARAEAVSDSFVQQVRLQRTIADAVLGLQEPWQTAVLLRFYGDMTSVEIGRQLNVPDATVRSWLHRALAELRQRLADETGARPDDLRSALLPFVLMRGPVGASSLGTSTAAGSTLTAAGVVLMTLKAKLALFALVATLAAGSWWVLRGPVGPAVATPPIAGGTAGPTPAPANSIARRQHDAGSRGAPAAQLTLAVLDARTRAALPDAAVSYLQSPGTYDGILPAARTDARGRASLNAGARSLLVRADGYADHFVSMDEFDPAGGVNEPEVLMNPCGAITGRVGTADGRPVGKVVVRAVKWCIPIGVDGEATLIPADAGHAASGTTDEAGEFVLTGLADGEEYQLDVVTPYYCWSAQSPRGAVAGSTATRCDLTLVPVYIYVVAARGLADNRPQMLTAPITVAAPLVKGLQCGARAERSMRCVAEMDFWISRVVEQHVRAIGQDAALLTYGVATPTDPGAPPTRGSASGSLGMASDPGAPPINLPSVAVVRFIDFQPSDILVVDIAQRSTDRSAVTVAFDAGSDIALEQSPPLIVRARPGTSDSPRAGGGTWCVGEAPGTIRTLRLPPGDYVLQPDYGAWKKSPPFGFAPQEFSVPETTRLAIRLDKPLGIVDLTVVDRLGNPISSFIVDQPSFQAVFGRAQVSLVCAGDSLKIDARVLGAKEQGSVTVPVVRGARTPAVVVLTSVR